VAHYLSGVRDLADKCVLWSLVPLGIYILLSGLDDLLVDVVWLYSWLRGVISHHPRVHVPSADELVSIPEKRIAIFVPLWHEHDVIGHMLAHHSISML
jgi:bacteriophage N4 adsorption protein B